MPEGRTDPAQDCNRKGRFALRAGNNATIAESEIFASEAEAREAVERPPELIAGIVQHAAAVTAGARFELSRDGSRWSFELLDRRSRRAARATRRRSRPRP